MDKWVISRLHSTIKKVTELADKYNLPWIPDELRDFIVHDISRWYIMLNREKLDIYSDDPHKVQIMAVLFNILFKFLIILAPVNPMLTENIYLKMFKSHTTSLDLEKTTSIHLQNWPDYDENKIDLDLEQQMHFTRDLIESVGAELWFLPPYSPDLNPIEKMWSKIKSTLRTLKARTEESLINAIAKALETITANDAKGWFESCGYTNTIN